MNKEEREEIQNLPWTNDAPGNNYPVKPSMQEELKEIDGQQKIDSEDIYHEGDQE